MVATDTMIAQDYAAARRLLVRAASLLYDRRLTELQGGRVEARSAEGEGTSIRLYLPAAPPEAQAGNAC